MSTARTQVRPGKIHSLAERDRCGDDESPPSSLRDVLNHRPPALIRRLAPHPPRQGNEDDRAGRATSVLSCVPPREASQNARLGFIRGVRLRKEKYSCVPHAAGQDRLPGTTANGREKLVDSPPVTPPPTASSFTFPPNEASQAAEVSSNHLEEPRARALLPAALRIELRNAGGKARSVYSNAPGKTISLARREREYESASPPDTLICLHPLLPLGPGDRAVSCSSSSYRSPNATQSEAEEQQTALPHCGHPLPRRSQRERPETENTWHASRGPGGEEKSARGRRTGLPG